MRTRRGAIGAATAVAALLATGALATSDALGAVDAPLVVTASAGGATVSVEASPYGPVLVVGGHGSGCSAATASAPERCEFAAGSSAYTPSIDPEATNLARRGGYTPGCTTTVVDGTDEGNLSCTGTESDQLADWPAFTTTSAPVAGPGVDPTLLGEVYRADLSTYQVTYAGHPLYLFDQGPSSFAGIDNYETVAPLPPWHTAWFLVAPDGLLATGRARLLTESHRAGTHYSGTVLAAAMTPTDVVPQTVSVYEFSRDTPFESRCLGACARAFVPLLTFGEVSTAAGVASGKVSLILRPDGSQQVTYEGHPLYLYTAEQVLTDAHHAVLRTGTAGNGSGLHGFGGTFRLLRP